MSDGFGEVVEKLRRSTVQIKTRAYGSGSGVIWSPDGQVVTNAHVIDSDVSDSVEVELWSGRRSTGRVMKRDRQRDLALVQVDLTGLPAAVVGDSRALRTGELVVAVGNPLGFVGAASTGIIYQAAAQGVQMPRLSGNRPWIVSQIRLAPGNSGGPLANARGEVVGINTMVSGSLAFAVPSRVVQSSLVGGSRQYAGLGVTVRAVQSKKSGDIAFLVLSIGSQSPADRASLLQGDILLGAEGRRFRTVEDLAAAVEAARGKALTVEFRRGLSANMRSVAVQLDSLPVRAAA